MSIDRTPAERLVIDCALDWAAKQERPYPSAALSRKLWDAVAAGDEWKVIQYARALVREHRRERPDAGWFGAHEANLYDAVVALEAESETAP